MSRTSTVVRFPKTTAQAARLKKLSRRDEPIAVTIKLLSDVDPFREQRAWRILFGLYQDCACVRWSKGFKKTPGVPFSGRMRPSRLPLFLREAVAFVAEGRAEIWIESEKLRPQLQKLMAVGA
jgi:hypothetical protein